MLFIKTQEIAKRMAVLEISCYPYSTKDLKTNYYKKAMECHPDTGGSEEVMKKVNEAYEYLQAFCLDDNGNGNGEDEAYNLAGALHKQEHIPEPLTLYDSCPWCGGTGVKEETTNNYTQCPNGCAPLWKFYPEVVHREGLRKMYEEKYFATKADYFSSTLKSDWWVDTPTYRKVKCNRCDNGQFILKSGRKVACLRCNGRGWLLSLCTRCYGTGEIFTGSSTRTVYCSTCRGTGKVKRQQENPVIQVGAILIGGKKLTQKERKKMGMAK